MSRRKHADLAVALTALTLHGCLSYTPREFSTMSAYDLCELQAYQRVNLTTSSRSLLTNELQRRNEDCRGVMPQIDKDRADDVYDRMYNRQSP